MIRLIQWLIFGHVHKYEEVEQADFTDCHRGKVIGKSYILRCEGCGEMKAFKVEV